MTDTAVQLSCHVSAEQIKKSLPSKHVFPVDFLLPGFLNWSLEKTFGKFFIKLPIRFCNFAKDSFACCS